MCSQPSYKDGYAPLIGMKSSELRKRIQDAGLGCAAVISVSRVEG